MKFNEAFKKLPGYKKLMGASNGHEQFPYVIERILILPVRHEKFDGLIYHMVDKSHSIKTALEIFGEIAADLEIYVYANRMLYLADDYIAGR